MRNWKVDRIFAIFAYCSYWLWPHMGHAVSKTGQNKCLDNEVFDLRETNWPRHHRIAGCWDGVESDHRPNCPQMLSTNAWSKAELSTALWVFMEKSTSQKSCGSCFISHKHDYLVVLADSLIWIAAETNETTSLPRHSILKYKSPVSAFLGPAFS